MRICKEHWKTMREAVDARGMTGLVAKDGKQAVDDAVADLRQEPDPENERFDPLMSMNWHWMNNALREGGLYLMGQTEDGSNDGHYCPLCEYAKHMQGFEADEAIGLVADQMLNWARGEGLVPQPS